MSIVYELYKSRGKKVCPPNYTRVQTCPLILRSTSEDLMTANTFGILKNLNPHIWLKRMLSEALNKDFSQAPLNNLTFSFWKKLSPPGNMAFKEGTSEVDMVIRFDQSIVLVEVKYTAPLSYYTTHGKYRNQVIRYIDVAINNYLCDQNTHYELYLIVLTSTEQEPGIIKRYRRSQNIFREITRSNFFIDYAKACNDFCTRIGWINWNRLRRILEESRDCFKYEIEQKFIDDLTIYLKQKEKEAREIIQERNGDQAQLAMFE